MFTLWYQASSATASGWRPICCGTSLRRLASLAGRLRRHLTIAVRITVGPQCADSPQRLVEHYHA